MREQRAYAVKEKFPRVTRVNLPKGVARVMYHLSLQDCEQYRVQQDDIISAIKEYEYGEN